MTPTQKALFRVISGTNSGTEITVHFNPVSLDYTITNTLDKGEGNSKKQHVSQSSGQLTMALIFDTTDEGSDVRIITTKIAQFMQPDEAKAPPVVQFEWGAYSFKGMLESFKETIDFFAPTGVPLRSNVNLTLAQQDVVFEPSEYNSNFDTQNSLDPDTVETPGAQNSTQLATQGGNPQAGRALAALNNQESMRFSSGPIAMPKGIDLKGPVAFSAGAGLGSGNGAGGGLNIGGAGLSLSAGAGGASLNLGNLAGSVAGNSAGDLSKSAGIGAAEGAFSGLSSSTGSSVRLDPLRLLPTAEAAEIGDVASVQVGGQSLGSGGSGLKADVGLKADLRSRIQFSSG